jgi:hypothetical protein
MFTTRTMPRPSRRATTQPFLVTLIAVLLVAAFLSPLLRAATSAVKSPEQLGQSGSPLLPSDIATIEVDGEAVELFEVPIDGTIHELALIKRGRTESQFDPANPPPRRSPGRAHGGRSSRSGYSLRISRTTGGSGT